jgi:hypothetical protein
MFFTGCKKDPDEQRLSWATEAPLSIPYRQRIQRLDKNLLRNGSFETGKILKVDSLKSSFVIDGWHQTGEHVEWVDIRNEALYSKNDVFTGYRSIKIVRRHANETDKQGEGVLSEFIKVIPGNYSFSFYTRLEKVMPVKSRLGIRMYDGIDIRLMFFDRNKNEIASETGFPQLNQSIDNSYKSLSFANFSAIPVFEWGKIIGRSADFPFPEGDIPTNAHYVKIFIGLKSTGTMWIDSVNFSYTRKNFSIEERMLAYTDTARQMPLIVIPTPKKMERQESVAFFESQDAGRLPLIVIPDKADIITRRAGILLRNALSYRVNASVKKNDRNPLIRIISADSAITVSNGLVFILGNTSLYPQFRDALPLGEIAGHPQGYYIYSPHDRPHVVFLGGNNSLGIYYAALTAIQLIDGKQPVFHNARIIDYPDFENRYFTLDSFPDQIATEQYAKNAEELAAYKMNGVFYGLNINFNQHEQLDIFREKVARQPSLALGIISQNKKIDAGLKAGRVVYAPKFIMPEENSLCYPEFMDLSFSDSDMVSHSMVIAPVYNNFLLDYLQYMNQTTYNPSTPGRFYSGRSFFSLNTDAADFTRYIAYAHSKPVFMDNSMLAPAAGYNGAMPYYPGKVRLFNIFEPFMNEGIRDHLGLLDTSMYWINQTAHTEIDVIRLATAADFTWNTRDYDPDFSLWKVLASRYGVDATRELIHYANEYGQILETELKVQRNEQVQRNLKNIREDLSVLSVTTRNLEKWLRSDHPLMKDIRSLNALLKARLELLAGSRVSNP